MMTVRQIKAAIKAGKRVMQGSTVNGKMFAWPVKDARMDGGRMILQSLEQPGQWYKAEGSTVFVRG